ncbi:MAG: hypothetical protein ACREHG_06970 [Candidatus Saccharimonadales bacterium]
MGNLIKHVQSCEPTSDTCQQQQMMNTMALGSTYSREKLRVAIATWTSRHRRPFQIVEDPEFVDMVKMLNPCADVPSRFSVLRDVKNLFELSKEKVKACLHVSYLM